jgi:hypothetical protein
MYKTALLWFRYVALIPVLFAKASVVKITQNTLFPKFPFTMLEIFTEATTEETFAEICQKPPPQQQKFVGVRYAEPFNAKASKEPTHFAFYRGTENASFLVIPTSAMRVLIKKAESIYENLRSMDGIQIPAGELPPKCPDPIVLEKINSQIDIVFTMEFPSFPGQEERRAITPLLSIRKRIKSQYGKGYYFDKAGVSMNPSSFYTLIEIGCKHFLHGFTHNVMSAFEESFRMDAQFNKEASKEPIPDESSEREPFDENNDGDDEYDAREEEGDNDYNDDDNGFRRSKKRPERSSADYNNDDDDDDDE